MLLTHVWHIESAHQYTVTHISYSRTSEPKGPSVLQSDALSLQIRKQAWNIELACLQSYPVLVCYFFLPAIPLLWSVSRSSFHLESKVRT